MKSTIKIKTTIVNKIINNLKIANSVVIVEYQKLTVAEFTKLRKIFTKQNIKIKVYKNNLFNLAAKKVGFFDLNQFLTGPNAFVFSTDKQMTAIKILSKFAKLHPVIKLKAGICNGKILNTKAIVEIAELPTKEELLSMFVTNLLYPLHMFTTIIKKIIIIKNK